MSVSNPFHAKVLALISQKKSEQESKYQAERKSAKDLLAELETLFNDPKADPNVRERVHSYTTQEYVAAFTRENGYSHKPKVVTFFDGPSLLSSVIKHAPEHCLCEVVKFLLDKKADPNFSESSVVYPSYQSPINVAIERGDIEVIKLLIARGAIVHVKEVDTSNNPLQRACSQVLYTSKRSHNGDLSVSSERLKIVELLIEAGAHYIANGKELGFSLSESPLFFAMEHEILPLLELLLSKNMSIAQPCKALLHSEPCYTDSKWITESAIGAAYRIWQNAKEKRYDSDYFMDREIIACNMYQRVLAHAKKYIEDLAQRAFKHCFENEVSLSTPEHFVEALKSVTKKLAACSSISNVLEEELMKHVYFPARETIISNLKKVSGSGKKNAEAVVLLIEKEVGIETKTIKRLGSDTVF